jgi:hypothetical protein
MSEAILDPRRAILILVEERDRLAGLAIFCSLTS